ncbi:MAG: dTMP kinase [Clostridiales bacterium]|nr:dTMP kinase [Clostridiales bacterium]
MAKGKFITVEGCEGVGKSTQVRLLKEYCEAHGIKALFTREPGGTPISEKIRALILDPENADMTDMTELLLYCAARAQHTEKVIKPALEAGLNVFCDRYSDSTTAYQGFARGLDLNTVSMLCSASQVDVAVDLTIFMDVSPDDGFARKGGKANDRLENETLAFHREVYKGFQALAAQDPDRYLCFKATGTKYDTHGEIVQALIARGILK